jgi:hypothetical protein
LTGAAGGGPAVGRSAVRRRDHSMVSRGTGIKFEYHCDIGKKTISRKTVIG